MGYGNRAINSCFNRILHRIEILLDKKSDEFGEENEKEKMLGNITDFIGIVCVWYAGAVLCGKHRGMAANR